MLLPTRERCFKKRKGCPTAINEHDPEQYSIPTAKRSCKWRKRKTLDTRKEIHVGTDKENGPEGKENKQRLQTFQ